MYILGLSYIGNRSYNQEQQLCELCDYDPDKLFDLEARLHCSGCYATPSDKETIDKILELRLPINPVEQRVFIVYMYQILNIKF